MANPTRTLVSAALFLSLGLAAAFAVSAVAGLRDEEPAPTGLQALVRGELDPASIRIEVLNGSGAAGLARDATHQLRGDGFDVVFFGNAARFNHGRSAVIDRTGQPDRARAVAAALGIDSVATAIDSALMLEVTVVLGRDWPPVKPVERRWSDRLWGLVRPDGMGRDSADKSGGADSAAADGG